MPQIQLMPDIAMNVRAETVTKAFILLSALLTCAFGLLWLVKAILSIRISLPSAE